MKTHYISIFLSCMVSFSFLLPCALCRGLQQHWQRGLLSLVFSSLLVSWFMLYLVVLLIYFNLVRRFFFFHFSLMRTISAPQVLLSNFIPSLCNAMNHANLLPAGDSQTPGSSSSLYPLFLSSFEASCLVSILPSISWVTWGF